MEPEAIVIGGVNGAGKTSFARKLLPIRHPGLPYLNADEIGSESPALNHPVAAGRELLRRLAEMERRREGFALETTLSSPMYARHIRSWREAGYLVVLHFIEPPSADFAIERVIRRVASGGHGVPEADIRRRFERGLTLFEQTYKPLVHKCYHWFADARGFHLGHYEEK